MNRNQLAAPLAAAVIALTVSGCGGAGKSGGDGAAANTSGANAPAGDARATNAPAATTTPSPGQASAAASTPNGTAAANNGAAKAAAPGAKTAAAPGPQIGSGGNDLYLFTKARAALNADAELRAANLVVEVREGVVTLTGTVADAGQRAKAEQLTAATEGVKSVRNQIKISAGR